MNQTINHGFTKRVDELQRLKIHIIVMMCLAGLLILLTMYFTGILRIKYGLTLLLVLIAIFLLLWSMYPTKDEMVDAAAADFNDAIEHYKSSN